MPQDPFKQLALAVNSETRGIPSRNITLRVPHYLEFALRSVADLQDIPYTRLGVLLLETALEQYAPIAVQQFEASGLGFWSDCRPSVLREQFGTREVRYDEDYGNLTCEEKRARDQEIYERMTEEE